MHKNINLIIIVCLTLFCAQSSGQLIISETDSINEIVEKIVGPGIIYSNVRYNGIPADSLGGSQSGTGSFTTDSISTGLGMESGIILATNEVIQISGPVSDGLALHSGPDYYNDPDLPDITGVFMYSCASLEFDFISVSDSLSINCIFGSEEYNESVCSLFNDGCAIFLAGPNIIGSYAAPSDFPGGSINLAEIGLTSDPITTNSVNNGSPGAPFTFGCTSLLNSSYYINNDSIGGSMIAYDGYTIPLFLGTSLTPDSTYHIKIVVGNGSDYANQSGIFISQNSMSSPCDTSITDIYVTECNSFISPSGLYSWNISGVYEDTLINSFGCDSIVVVNLTITSVDTSITNISPTLIANTDSAIYQWIYCDSTALFGETGQNFIADTNGEYAVVITENGCTDTSSCITVSNVGINELSDINRINVYPNPMKKELIIDMQNEYLVQKVSLIDLLGRELYSSKKLEKTINTSELKSGVYLLIIQSNNIQSYIKVIKN